MKDISITDKILKMKNVETTALELDNFIKCTLSVCYNTNDSIFDLNLINFKFDGKTCDFSYKIAYDYETDILTTCDIIFETLETELNLDSKVKLIDAEINWY